MTVALLSLELRSETDIILARQRARQVAGLLGFAPLDQTRIATALSEIARNAFLYGGGGRVEFLIETGPPQGFIIRVLQRGAGIDDLQALLGGGQPSPGGLGPRIVGARRLMDAFEAVSSESGATITMRKKVPDGAPVLAPADLARITETLADHAPQGLLEELQLQNRELLRTLQELRDRQAEIAQLHSRELEETNRGVVALYTELDENAKALKRVSDLKTRFLSNMSHEFRSPLNTILSMSGFLLDGSSGALTPEQQKEIGFIRKAAEGLSTLVNDLLDLAKVEAGKATVHASSFEVAAMFETLVGTTRPLLVLSPVTLAAEVAEGGTTLVTDEGKLAQILRNFVSNAVKFTESGQIRIAAVPGPGDTVIFSVADTGIGISRADQARIFEEFGQVEGALQRRTKGTGLGLPLSRRLAELLGGEVSVRSEPGVGSTFYAVIPRVFDGPVSERSVTPSDDGRPAVLVVQDDPVEVLLYEKLLAEAGYRALFARTIEEARRVVREGRPSAVFLDLALDAEGRWSLISTLSARPDGRDLPVFVLTHIDGGVRVATLSADEFGVEPVADGWLLEKLRTLAARTPIARVLIVDDDDGARTRLGAVLSAHGRFVIIEAVDGRDGIRLATDEHPDLIVLSLVLPDMTGVEVRERLKSSAATRDIPVLIQSVDPRTDEPRRLRVSTASILPRSTGTIRHAFAAIHDALQRASIAPVPPAPGA